MSAINVLSAPESERALIAAIMREKAIYDDATDAGVTEATFTDARNRRIFRALKAQVDAGGEPDLVGLQDALGGEDVVYAAQTFEVIATGVKAAEWISRLRQCEGRRAIQRAASEAMRKLLAGDISEEDFAAVIEEAKEKARTVGGQIKPLSEVGEEFAETFLSETPPPLIPVFPQDTEVGRQLLFRQGQILVIAAGAGIGKTQLAAQAVVEQVNAGLRVLYICTETVSAEIFARILSPMVNSSHFSLLYANRPLGVVDKFRAATQAAVATYSKYLAVVGVESGSLDARRFRSLMAEAAAKLGGVDVVVVDYIQDFDPLDARASANDNTAKAMSIIAHTVKRYRAAAIVLSQINRTGQNAKQGEEPNLSWLKDCSKIGELANTVCFLLRKGDESTLYCVKSRDCLRFAARLEYRGAKYVSAPASVESEKYALPYGGKY